MRWQPVSGDIWTMGKILNVSTVAQTSSDTCWHAAATMLWNFSQQTSGRQGPMHTLGEQFTKNKVIFPAEWVTLAERVGLAKVPDISGELTEERLSDLLTRFGPLWCAGRWFGVGHAIVLTGVGRDVVFFNDPDRGVKKTNMIRWFNEKLFKEIDGCLMYKDPTKY